MATTDDPTTPAAKPPKAPKASPSPTVRTDIEEARILAQLLIDAGVDPAKAADMVNNKDQYGSIDAFIAAAGLAPAPRTAQPYDAYALPSKYGPYPNAVNAWNWYISHGYTPEMVEIWLDDRINRGGLYKDSRTLITSINPRALLNIGAARLAES